MIIDSKGVVQLNAEPERGPVRLCLPSTILAEHVIEMVSVARHKDDFQFSITITITITSARLTVLLLRASCLCSTHSGLG